LLAETEANLQQLTDELEEVLASKGQNLSTVAPELDVMKQRQAGAGGGEAAGSGWSKSASGQWTSGGDVGSPSVRSMWQQKEEQAQRVRVRTTQPISLSLHCSPTDAALDCIATLVHGVVHVVVSQTVLRFWCSHSIESFFRHICWCNRTTSYPKRSVLRSEGAARSSFQTTRSAYSLSALHCSTHEPSLLCFCLTVSRSGLTMQCCGRRR
jgi:hypothetical protein